MIGINIMIFRYLLKDITYKTILFVRRTKRGKKIRRGSLRLRRRPVEADAAEDGRGGEEEGEEEAPPRPAVANSRR
jgi:hypothetical protein